MMKVALITERADIALGGAERSVFELCEALQNTGLDAHIVAAKGNRQQDWENVHLLCEDIPGKRTKLSAFEHKLKIFLSENKFDIIHSVLPFDFADVYQPRGGSYAEAIIRNAASYNNSFITAYKKLTSFANLRRTYLHKAERKLCSNPNGPIIAALSNYVAGQFTKHYDVNSERIAVIHNGIKTENKIDENAVENLQKKLWAKFSLTKQDKPIFLLFAANNFRLKGLKTLIKAIQLLTEKITGCPFYLVVAGNGDKKKYLQLAQRLSVSNRIFFYGPVENIRELLEPADIAVLPTFYDPSSRFILESLAAGKPVITTSFNGAAELFEDNRHGLKINDPTDEKQLAEALAFFAERQNICNFSNNIIADKIKDKVSITRAAREVTELYKSIQAHDR